MDIMLERMLSLIPKKPDGKYVHGAKKEFCERIGAPTNIISEWMAGKTKSYRNYVYAAASEYNVSVEWLKGKTDAPTPARHEKIAIPETGNSEDNEITLELIEKINKLSIQDKVLASQILDAMLLKKKGE